MLNPLRPAEAPHLSSAPLRPSEAPQCCPAAARRSAESQCVLPRCRPAKRFRVDPLWPGEAIQCGPAEARRSDAVLPLGAVTSGPLPGMKAAPSRFRIRKCGLAGTLAARDVGSAVLLVPRGRFRIRKWHLGRFPRSKVRPCWYGEALHLSVAPLRPGEARRNSFPLHTLKGPTSSKKPIFNPGSPLQMLRAGSLPMSNGQ